MLAKLWTLLHWFTAFSLGALSLALLIVGVYRPRS